MKFAPHQKYGFEILDLCSRIHGSVIHSGNSYPNAALQLWADWLAWRVQDGVWGKTKPDGNERYDNAIRALAEATMAMAYDHIRKETTP